MRDTVTLPKLGKYMTEMEREMKQKNIWTVLNSTGHYKLNWCKVVDSNKFIPRWITHTHTHISFILWIHLTTSPIQQQQHQLTYTNNSILAHTINIYIHADTVIRNQLDECKLHAHIMTSPPLCAFFSHFDSRVYCIHHFTWQFICLP